MVKFHNIHYITVKLQRVLDQNKKFKGSTSQQNKIINNDGGIITEPLKTFQIFLVKNLN